MAGTFMAIPGTGGSGGTGIEAPALATMEISSDETTTDTVITAGKIRVKIENVGPVGGGSTATATVNGQNLFPGRTIHFEAFWDAAAGELLKTPELSIVTNGATIWYQTEA